MPTKKAPQKPRQAAKAARTEGTISWDEAKQKLADFAAGPGGAGKNATAVQPRMHAVGCRCSTCETQHAKIGLEVAKLGGLAVLVSESDALRESQQATAAGYRALKRCLASERHRHNSAKAAARHWQDACQRITADATANGLEHEEARLAAVTEATQALASRDKAEQRMRDNERLLEGTTTELDTCFKALQVEKEAKEAAEATIRRMEQEAASLRRQVNERDADLASERAGRKRERNEYLEARRSHDDTLFKLNFELADSRKAADGFAQASEAEYRQVVALQKDVQMLVNEMAPVIRARDAAQAEARTADAHLANVRRELADARLAIDDQLLHLEHAEARALERNETMRALRHNLDAMMETTRLILLAANGRMREIHAQLTEGIEIHGGSAEIVRTLRAVRVMLFPPHGQMPEAPQA